MNLIESARQWLDTPWQHNQHLMGVGVDCVNFLYYSGIDAELPLSPIPSSYGRIAKGDTITNYLNAHFIKKDKLVIFPEDILLFQFSGFNNHVAIATDNDRMIHASVSHGKVVEHTIDGVWLRILKGVWEIGRNSSTVIN